MDLFIKEDWNTGTSTFYLRGGAQDVPMFIGFNDNHELIRKMMPVDGTVQAAPILLTLPTTIAEVFTKAFAEYLSSKGISTENETLLRGKLMATEKHLEDMRTISSQLMSKIIQ